MSVSGVVYEGPEGAPVVTLYTKAECTLCDKVKEVLKTVAADAPHSFVQVDITDALEIPFKNSFLKWKKYF